MSARPRVCHMCSHLWRPKSWRNYRCPRCGAWDDLLLKRRDQRLAQAKVEEKDEDEDEPGYDDESPLWEPHEAGR